MRRDDTSEGKENPITGKINSIKIHNTDRIEDREQEGTDLLPKDTPIPMDFWESPNLDELAECQGIQPPADGSQLFGTWPGDPDDRFEEKIRALRQQNQAGGERP
jgi:hypothetical protein